MRALLETSLASAFAALCLSLVVSAASPGLMEAVKAGDEAAVRSLLKDGADVNAAQSDGMTALHWAALERNVRIAQMLLHAGAFVEARTRLGAYTPLLMAAKNGDASMMDTLLTAGADPHDANHNGTTALMFAAASGDKAAIQLLLDRDADVNRTERAKGQTAVMFAAGYGRADAIRVLTARGADLSVTTTVRNVAALSREEASPGAPAPRQPAQDGSKPAGWEQRDAPRPAQPQMAGIDRGYLYHELVGTEGGLTTLLIAARQGDMESVHALLEAGADVNQPSAGDKSTALLVATINGHFDLAKFLLDRGADPRAAADNGVTPLYAVVNCQWAQKALYPQPRAHEQQRLTYLDLMRALLDRGADPNARVKKKVWYSGYNADFSSIDEQGATPFWRAAYASDVDGMKLLVAHGADPRIPTAATPGRRRSGGGLTNESKDVSGLPPVPVGGPGMTPLHGASGPGYGEGFAGNAHRTTPLGMLPAVKYLVEELHADVNAVDQYGNTALHNAAARGDNEMIMYLMSHRADLHAVNRAGQTVLDMANGPVQRVQPFPKTIALLAKFGVKNNNKCVSC